MSSNAAKGSLGLHRMIEAMKHMLAVRMNLGDPDFVNISSTVSDMLSPSFAKEIQRKIFDNTTYPPDYYLPRSDKFCFRLKLARFLIAYQMALTLLVRDS